MVIALVLSVLCLVAMATIAESAPQEAVWVGLACYCAICARIAQARGQTDRMMGTLMESRDLMSALVASSGERGAAAVEEIGGGHGADR